MKWEVSARLDPAPPSPWVLDYTGWAPLPEEFRFSHYNAERWRTSKLALRSARRSDPEAYAMFPGDEEELRARLRQELRRKA